jgi:hypothetical protein
MEEENDVEPPKLSHSNRKLNEQKEVILEPYKLTLLADPMIGNNDNRTNLDILAGES